MGEPLKLNNEGVVTVVHAKMRLISTYLKKSLKKNSVNSNGLSMLEAVVVVGVLLALAVSGFIAYGPITDNAKHAVVKSEASKIYTAATVAQVDGDPSTTMATVLDDYNNSTDKIRILVRRSTDTDFTSTPDASFDSADGDYCIRAEQIGDESIYSETGMCVASGDGPGDPGDGSGDPGDGDPGNVPPPAPVLNPNALTVLSYKCDSTKQVDSPFYFNVTGTETWSDGVTATSTDTFNPAPRTLQAGVAYTVTFKGTYGGFGTTNDTCVRSLDQWDDGTGVKRAAYAFKNTPNLVSVPESIPSTLTDMSYMFASNDNFNSPNVSKWNTANVTNMSYMFSEAAAFNQPLATWNTGKVTDMNHMFYRAQNFDQALSTWNVSKVTDMSYLFDSTEKFNQPLNAWDTSSVTNMANLFEGTELFDQPLNNWNTSNVTSMNTMFGAAKAFNQPIGSWNTGNVTDMSYMFGTNTTFKQSLNSWDTSKVTDFSGMFSYGSYNQPLNNWNTSSAIKMDNMFTNNEAFDQSLNSWNVSNVTDMHSMFWRASSFNQPLNNWNTSNVANMSGLFSSAIAFDQPLNNWNTSKVEDMTQMFMMAFSFNRDLSSWDMSSMTPSGRSDFAKWADSWTLPKPSGF